MPVAVVVSVVVFLIGLAALCGALAVWTVLADRQPRPQVFRPVEPPAGLPVTQCPPARFRPSVPFEVSQTATVMPPRLPAPGRLMHRGGPRLPPPLPRAMIRGTPIPGRDDDYDDDYTEVDDGVTLIRDLRVAARR